MDATFARFLCLDGADGGAALEAIRPRGDLSDAYALERDDRSKRPGAAQRRRAVAVSAACTCCPRRCGRAHE
jgi:hypothetical protein